MRFCSFNELSDMRIKIKITLSNMFNTQGICGLHEFIRPWGFFSGFAGFLPLLPKTSVGKFLPVIWKSGVYSTHVQYSWDGLPSPPQPRPRQSTHWRRMNEWRRIDGRFVFKINSSGNSIKSPSNKGSISGLPGDKWTTDRFHPCTQTRIAHWDNH